MKNLLIIVCSTLILSFTNKNLNNDFSLDIHDTEKAENLVTSYLLSNEKLVIKKDIYFYLDEKTKPKEEIVFEYKLTAKDKVLISNKVSNIKFDNTFEEMYFNPCIIDGLDLFVSLKNKDETYSSSIANVYEPRVDSLVQIINLFSPKEYQIWYGKEDLQKWMKDCK